MTELFGAKAESAPVSGAPNSLAWGRLLPMRGDSGQSVLEAALVMPIMLLTIFGMIQASILMLLYCNVTYACRNGARYASMHSSTALAPSSVTQIQSIVRSGLFLNAGTTPTINVTYLSLTYGTGANVVGDLVSVQASWSETVSIPFMHSMSVSVGTHTDRYISR
jgi:Flp pilus assembly protein TadG